MVLEASIGKEVRPASTILPWQLGTNNLLSTTDHAPGVLARHGRAGSRLPSSGINW